jgi:ATP-dependent DNA helicase RecG
MIIQEGKGLTVEFKEHFTPRIAEDMVAFANTRGGRILLGVNDRKKVIGEKLTNDLKARINALARNCTPPMEIKIKQVNDVVVVDVPQGGEKPYGCSGGYFRRLDGTTQKMTNHELRIMFRENEEEPFEDKINKDITWEDISKKKIQAFLKEASIRIQKAVPQEIMTSLNVVHKDKITNAGILFFAKDPKRYIFHAKMTLIAFKGTDRIHIYDRQDITDDLLTQFNEAILFLKRHLNVRSEIVGVNRRDIYEIPFEALREAIANAIIHRDYNVRGTSITIEVYDDRVEITNPGGLPKGLAIKDFGKISIRRNEHIADLFFRMDKVELAGTGIRRMKDAMAQEDLPSPKIKQANFFTITFKRLNSADLDRIFASRTTLSTPPVLVEKGVEKGVEKLSPIERALYLLITANPSISKHSMCIEGGLTKKMVEYNLEKLREKGIIKRVGPDRGGRWEIVDNQ